MDTKLHGTFLQRHGEVLRMVQDSFKKAETICADVLQVRLRPCHPLAPSARVQPNSHPVTPPPISCA